MMNNIRNKNSENDSIANNKNDIPNNTKISPEAAKKLRIFSVLLLLFSVLLFLALFSYTPRDEANTEVTISEIMGLFKGDDIIQAKAETTQNLLGLFGAIISHFLYNNTFGYSILILPIFLSIWAIQLIKNYHITDRLLKNTLYTFLLAVWFSCLMGSLQLTDFFASIPKEWSGLIGQFIASIISSLLGAIGSILLFITCIGFALVFGFNITIDTLKQYYSSSMTFINNQLDKIIDFNNKIFVKTNADSTKKDAEYGNINSETNIEDIEEETKETFIPDDDYEEAARIIRRNVNIEISDDPRMVQSSILRSSSIPNYNNFSQNISDSENLINQDQEESNKLSELKFEPIIEEIIDNHKSYQLDDLVNDNLDNNDLDNSFDNNKNENYSYNAINNIDEELITQLNNDEININNNIENEAELNKELASNKPIEEELVETEYEVVSEINSGINHISTISNTPINNNISFGLPNNSEVHTNFEPLFPLSTAIHDEELEYSSPQLEFLVDESNQSVVDDEELKNNARILQEKLETFKIYIENLTVTPGPVVTQYEFIPAAGIKISKIEALADDISMALKAKGIRIIAPIPGKGTVGIEIPNQNPSIVRFSSIVSSPQFNKSNHKLPLALGKTIVGDVFCADLSKMPHLLVAGSTGSGKSVGINTIIVSLLYKMHPSELKFVIIDPKKVELNLYAELRNHFLAVSPDIKDTIITKPEDAVTVLKSLCAEMDQRYDLLAKVGQRNIFEYNKKVKDGKLENDPEYNHRAMPFIVVIIDELADLMLTAAKEVEVPITRLAQLARAVGIHLVVATQRPSVDVITGIIKANFPARMAYLVASKIDSRTILDVSGADQLLGNGDMLFLPGGSPKPLRIQNAFISTDEIERICQHIGNQIGYSEPYYLPSLKENDPSISSYSKDDRDALFEEAAKIVIHLQQGSVSLIQRRLKVGYARAGRIVDELEAAGVLGPFDGSKARQVLLDSESDLEAIL